MFKHYKYHHEHIAVMCESNLGKYFDEYLRPDLKPRSLRDFGDYGHENPHYFSAIFACLLELKEGAVSSIMYKSFYRNEVLKNCRVEAGLYSRQPFGANAYPEDHPSGEEWNYISKDEYVGITYFANPDERMEIVEWGAGHSWTYDDYKKKTTLRRWHPWANQYYYVEASKWYSTNWIQRLAFKLSKKHEGKDDSVIKDYIRGRVLGEDIAGITDFLAAIRTYFPKKHPFCFMAEEIYYTKLV